MVQGSGREKSRRPMDGDYRDAGRPSSVSERRVC